MSKRVKIYLSNTNDYKLYDMEQLGSKFHIKRFESPGYFSSDWSKIGMANSFEDAITLARADATSFGSITKVEIS